MQNLWKSTTVAIVRAANLKMYSIMGFIIKLSKYVFRYILFILPFILIFKSVYLCLHEGILTSEFFSHQFICNIPFLGEKLAYNIWGDNLILSLEKIQNNQKITQLIFTGGLGSCLGKTIFETWFSDYFKVPMTYRPADHLGGPSPRSERPVIKIPLILQSTQGGGSDLNVDSGLSNLTVQGTYNLPTQSSAKVPPVKGSVDDMSSTGFWKVALDTFNEEISPCFDQHTKMLNKMNDKEKIYRTL
jgi:hypothetical protein